MIDMQTLTAKRDKLAFDAKQRLARAEQENRPLTDDEQTQHDAEIKSLEDLGKKIAAEKSREDKHQENDEFHAALQALAGDQGPSRLVVSRVGGLKSFGQTFVESKAYKWLQETKATRSGQWTSEAVEIDRKALTEDPASGGGLVVPDYQRVIHPGPIQPIVVADLLAPGTTGSNVVPVMVEESFTNNAAPVAEGGVKPESALTFVAQSEPVRKIAHWIPVSEELLEDAPAVASYIDSRLRYGVLRKEDQQLLYGTGVAPQLQGILARTGLAAPLARTDPDTNADAILKQIVLIEAASGLPVTGIVMNPLAWGSIALSKDENAMYLAGGPFAALPGPTLWGRQVALTDQITSTEALVGAFKSGAQIFRHGGVRVATTNSHSDFFTKNLVAIRAEERLALAVYRPGAFAKVTNLTVVAGA
jgi:HK97 family phage major capsid protein